MAEPNEERMAVHRDTALYLDRLRFCLGLAFDVAVRVLSAESGDPPLEVEQETWFDSVGFDGQFMTVKFGYSNLSACTVEIDTDRREVREVFS